MSIFHNRVAIVTGATCGIGRSTAVAFGKQGAKVVVAGRHQSDGEESARLVKASGGEGIFVRTDVSIEEDVRALVEKTVQSYGRLDFAYNNAGAETTASLVDETEDHYRLVMDTNVKGTFLCLKYEIQQMLKNGGGAIVNASSAAGIKPVPFHGLYVASKHAVIGLTKTAALEFAKKGVRVNAVCAATIDGAMLRAYITKAGLTEQMVEAPIGRIGKPEDVAEAVLFLCSDKASYITGATLSVDGGFVL